MDLAALLVLAEFSRFKRRESGSVISGEFIRNRTVVMPSSYLWHFTQFSKHALVSVFIA
jgi:hypothetical protein